MTTQEMIAVMQAYDEGKEIQVANKGGDNWSDIINPTFNFTQMDYRIKPEEPKPKLRPYANAEEFLQAQKEHGPFLRSEKWYQIPMYVDNQCIAYIDDECQVNLSYSELVKSYDYIWQDGTPCGIIEEE